MCTKSHKITQILWWLSCGVFLVKHFWLPLAQTIRPNWHSLLAGGSVAIQTWNIYKAFIPEEIRTITVPSLDGLKHDFTF